MNRVLLPTDVHFPSMWLSFIVQSSVTVALTLSWSRKHWPTCSMHNLNLHDDNVWAMSTQQSVSIPHSHVHVRIMYAERSIHCVCVNDACIYMCMHVILQVLCVCVLSLHARHIPIACIYAALGDGITTSSLLCHSRIPRVCKVAVVATVKQWLLPTHATCIYSMWVVERSTSTCVGVYNWVNSVQYIIEYSLSPSFPSPATVDYSIVVREFFIVSGLVTALDNVQFLKQWPFPAPRWLLPICLFQQYVVLDT